MIAKHITDFNESLNGLRDFVDLINPYLSEKAEEHDKHVRPIVISALLTQILSSKTDWESGEKEEFLEMQTKIKKELTDKYSEEPEVFFQVNEKEGKTVSFKIRSSNTEISEHIENAQKTNNHISLLYTNSLISLLSNVEWFFSQILHYHYDKYPESAGVQKKTLTLADLKSFTSVADAEKYLIDVKIDEVLRGNFESWTTLLKEEIGLGLGYLKDIMDELIEIYQRRNLFVHNGGVVNSIYFSKVQETLRKDLSIGDISEVDKTYLENSICKLQKAFTLIGAELWKKLDPEDESRGEILGHIIYENLLHARWDLCEGLCYFSLKDALINPVDKTIAQINYWLCKKELGQYEIIKKELEKVDFSDKKEIFQLGIFALKGESEKIIEILPILLDTNQINIERIEEFPILKDFRETLHYKDFKNNSKYFQVNETKNIEHGTLEK